MTDWRDAYDSRQEAVRAHPMYPALFHRAARWEAAGVHPLYSHYDPVKGRDTVLINDQIWFLRWRQTAYGRSYPSNGTLLESMVRVTQMMLPDLFTEDERLAWSQGDMEAAIYGTALTDVRARLDFRRATEMVGKAFPEFS